MSIISNQYNTIYLSNQSSDVYLGRSATHSALTPLSTTIVVINSFYQPIKSLLLGIKCVFKHQGLQKFGAKLNKSKLFHPLELVVRGSETHILVGKKIQSLM